MTASLIASFVDKFKKLDLDPAMTKNRSFYDEAPVFFYNTLLKISKKNTDGIIKEHPHGTGISFFKAEEALSKSIYEAMERFCEFCYKKSDIKYGTYKDTPDFIDVSPFVNREIDKSKIGWIEGVNLLTNQKCFIPARLAYLSYRFNKGEPSFDFPRNSTGSAGGASPEHAILSGIYEIIERDGFMTIYLNKISPPKLNPSSLKDKRIDRILDLFKKYKLETYILDTTTDLAIPSFLVVLIDGCGFPSVAIGAKASIRYKDAIVGALEEAMLCRLATKNMLREGKISPDLKSGDDVFAGRARNWILPQSIEYIRFLINGSALKYRAQKEFKGTIKEELKIALSKIKQKGLFVYSCDITIKEFKSFGFFAYQTIIPGLQPLYLFEPEKKKALNTKRLKEVAGYFNQEQVALNEYPHPFL